MRDIERQPIDIITSVSIHNAHYPTLRCSIVDGAMQHEA